MVDVATFPEPGIGAQLAELKRERKMRERVYPHWISSKKITKQSADYQMLCLDAAIKTLERVAVTP